MKYNIGDRVVRIRKEFYDNSFHNKTKFIESAIVSDVYEYRSNKGSVFYINGQKHQIDSIGDSAGYQYNEYRQSDGIRTEWPHEDYVPFLHIEKDKEKIQQLIKEAEDDFSKYCEEQRQKEIRELESKIKYAQERIAKLKEHDSFRYISSVKSEAQWKREMDEVINKAIKG